VPLDTLIKKFFPAIVGAIIAVIAYLQASGVVELVAQAVFGGDESDQAEGASPHGRRTPPPHVVIKSAAKILSHNPFDHETDLNPKPEPKPEPDADDIEPKGGIDVSDPLNVDACPGVEVQIVTESPDPTWSIAVLKGPKEERAFLRRVGDKVEDFEVQYIGYNRLQRSPAVWMSQSNKLCQALLFSTSEAAAASSSGGAPTPPPTSAKPAAKPPQSGGIADEIAQKIEKVSETEFNVDRSVVDNILENQAQLMRTARIVPEKGADGKTVGIRLFGVRPNTLLGTLGLQNGDRLETINGFEMASPEKALEAYARLRTASKLTIKITRRGQPVTLDFNIK
jgi:general secretion pathway protein C